VDRNTFSDDNSKSTIFSLFAETTFFNKQNLSKKEFTRVDLVWLIFLEVLDPKCTQLGQKSCFEISKAIYLGPKR